MKIDIIGGGIGGLTTAIELIQKGFDVKVYEQAATIKEVGAGIVLANNAMQVYKKLGLKSKLEAAGNLISKAQIVDANLKVISGLPLSTFEEKFGVKNVAIHRAVLQKILTDELPEGTIVLDRKLSAITPNETGYTLQFENGTTVESEVLIGADGINSQVRKNIFEYNEIRNSHQVCWRGVADFELPENRQSELNESWGKGGRFGFVQISKGKVYWFAVKHSTGDKFKLDQLGKYYEHFDPLVSKIINATPTDKIHTADLTDLKPYKNWAKGKACVIGDAAHATTPNMGQGACQSIEDAYTIAECLAKYPAKEAFLKYQKLRIKKAHQIVNTSWMIGKLAHWQNPIATSLRNNLMRMTPESVNKKQLISVFELAEV